MCRKGEEEGRRLQEEILGNNNKKTDLLEGTREKEEAHEKVIANDVGSGARVKS